MSNEPLAGPESGSYLVDGRCSMGGPASGGYFEITVNRDLIAINTTAIYNYDASLDYRIMRVDQAGGSIVATNTLSITNDGVNVITPVGMGGTSNVPLIGARNVLQDDTLAVSLVTDGTGTVANVAIAIMCYTRGHVFPLDSGND